MIYELKEYFNFTKIVRLNIERIRFEVLISYIFFIKVATLEINNIKSNKYEMDIDINV